MNIKKAILISSIVYQGIYSFGGWSISLELFQYIRTKLQPGNTILELGSGQATEELAKFYTMYSIEHNVEWLNKYKTNYIYAPIQHYSNYNWYDTKAIKQQMPIHYDLILIDGPPGNIGRIGFFYNLELFKTNVPIIFDDVNRLPEYDLLKEVATALNKPYRIYKCADGKAFGVINERNK